MSTIRKKSIGNAVQPIKVEIGDKLLEIVALGPACLYEGCNSIRSLGTGHFGLGFSGRVNILGFCISYKLPHPGKVHLSLFKATQSRHNRCLHGVMTGNRHHSLHLKTKINT